MVLQTPPTPENMEVSIDERINMGILALPASVFGLTEISNCNVTSLDSGHHNYNFRIELNNDATLQYIVRFHPGTSSDNDPILGEFGKLKSLNGLHCPRVHYVGAFEGVESQVLIMEFIPGEHKDFEILTDDEIGSLAQAIKDIHGITSDTYSSRLGAQADSHGTHLSYANALISSTIDNRIAKLNPDIYKNDAQLIHNAIKQLHDWLKISENAFTSTQFSVMHTDIWSLNVIWDEGKPTFIDWEDMCYGDPADEVAYIFAINNVSDHFKKYFLDTYVRSMQDTFFSERLRIYTLKARLFDLIWSIKKLDEEMSNQPGYIQKEKGVYEEYYIVRLNALKKFIGQV